MDNINPVEVYTSTGGKFLHHPEALQRIQSRGKGSPISLQVAPTSVCNLRCVFCSNTNRDKHEALNPNALLEVVRDLVDRGLKTVEWTGGGDPTQYHYINEAIELVAEMGLQQGFITNGIELRDKVSQKSLDKLDWVRVSMNCLDYVEVIELPKHIKTLGFSYVMNDKTTLKTFERMGVFIEKYNPSYIRIVPNCQVSHEDQVKNNASYSVFVKEQLGPPYFYQTKSFKKPDDCWWCYFKPFILHDGFVYPCSSVVLNDNAERSFHEKYRWCSMDELGDKYNMPMKPFSPKGCTHCVFTDQNKMVEDIMKPNPMTNFI